LFSLGGLFRIRRRRVIVNGHLLVFAAVRGLRRQVLEQPFRRCFVTVGRFSRQLAQRQDIIVFVDLAGLIG
jgi:hypothetical protein